MATFDEVLPPPGACWAWREGGWRCIRPDDGHEHAQDEPDSRPASVVLRPARRRRTISAGYVDRLRAQGASPFTIEFAEQFVEREEGKRVSGKR